MGVVVSIVFVFAGCTADGTDKRDESPRGAPDPVNCFGIRTEGHPCPGIELSIRLSDDSMRSGGTIKGRLVLENTNDFSVEVDGDQPEVAYFRDPENGRRVGGYEGAIAGTGWGAVLAPGQSASIPLIVAAVEPPRNVRPNFSGKQPPLGPGRYLLAASTASCNLNQGGSCKRLPPAELPITVTPRLTFDSSGSCYQA